jgi:predicted Zn-dependent protease
MKILGATSATAGTSFVTPDMFGKFQYGSELLNVSWTQPFLVNLATDSIDDGGPATKQLPIENGVKRGLGAISQQMRV